MVGKRLVMVLPEVRTHRSTASRRAAATTIAMLRVATSGIRLGASTRDPTENYALDRNDGLNPGPVRYKSINHSFGEYVRTEKKTGFKAHTNTVESFNATGEALHYRGLAQHLGSSPRQVSR